MTSYLPLPEGTKHDIMNRLLRQELSAQSLAESLGVSAAAVRQHLDTLKALGLVVRRKVVTQPSRPTYLYRLSPHGIEAFPKRYDLLLSLLIDAMLERQGPHAVSDVVAAAARRLADRVRPRFGALDERRRWDLLVSWLEEELAWRADVAQEAGARRITIHHCPFHEVSRHEPAVCGVFFRTLVQALYGDVGVEHIPAPGGPACCSLVIGSVAER